MKRFFSFAAGAASVALACSAPALAKTQGTAARPNFVVIVADDMGYSDIGAFGGEIRTPNLDALAKKGLRLTDFHAAPTCSPTRSMLLSGTDNHTAGVGAMAEAAIMFPRQGEAPEWGYEGVLTTRVATLAERLREGGYYTAMSGKWHLGLKPEQDPHARGFEASFALLQGGSNHYGGGLGPEGIPMLGATYTQNGKPVDLPEDFYSSDYFTTKMIDQLKVRPKDKPFFAYLTYTAPHWPLMAPPEDIARYEGRYDKGWDALRAERLERLKALGLVSQDAVAPPMWPDASAWEKLTPDQKKTESRKMEIYAAMVDRLDQNVGRLIKQLKKSGAYENTIIVFMSDNGASGETMDFFTQRPPMSGYMATRDNSYTGMGSKNSFVSYGPYWAQAAMAPSRLYKGVVTEGGMHVPAFITYPGFKRQGEIGGAFGNVMDIVPTFLDAAGVPLENTVDGREVAPVRGQSMLPYLRADSTVVHIPDEPVSFELHGHRAVRQGKWKLVRMPKPLGTADWVLYDLSTDPAEQNDLSAQYPERKAAMIAAWDVYVKEAHINEHRFPDVEPR